jgi:hypothetical protein
MLMKYEKAQKGPYVVFRILEDINLNSDITPLTILVEQNLQMGKKHIAFTFGQNSFLYTRHIAVLVKCLEMLREESGSLAIVHPNRDIMDVLALIDPEHLIVKAETEDDLVSVLSSK